MWREKEDLCAGAGPASQFCDLGQVTAALSPAFSSGGETKEPHASPTSQVAAGMMKGRTGHNAAQSDSVPGYNVVEVHMLSSVNE